MTYCHECGSEVAELDIFCPYCGISLSPVPVSGSEAEDEMASTVVMPLPIKLSGSGADPAGSGAAAGTAAEPQPGPVESVEDGSHTEVVSSSPEKIDELPAAPATFVPSATAAGLAEDADIDSPPEEDGKIESEAPVEQASKTSDEDLAAEEHFTAPSSAKEDADVPVDELSAPVDSEAELASSFVTDEMDNAGPVDESVDAEEVTEGSADADHNTFATVAEGDQAETVPPQDSVDEIASAASGVADIHVPEVSAEPEAHIVSEDLPETSGTTPNIGSGATTDGRKGGLKPLSEGTMLSGRYRIVKKIGGGGMGAVYLAFDQNLGGTQRAVKEMVQSHIEEEQQAKAIEDFKRESMILSTLDHPAIPTIYDYFYDDVESRFYLVMKYISGGDLASRLRAAPEGRVDERTVTEWAIQIIDVLDYLHSLPTVIVYRDLKPSNVMIDGNTGRIMLIDFGIARSINQNQEKGVTAVGTMGYAPPELFSGQVEPRSDIYSLGSTMFHLLTGADPQNNPLLIFDFQKNPRPRQINPRLSDQMERILMRAVEYNADARFASAADMRNALQDHLENLRSGNVTYGITESPTSVSLAYQTVFCGFCGQRIVATDLFCAFCGSKQPIAQQGVHSEIYSRGNVTARLVIEGTSDLSAPAYSLEKNENLVGRRDPMSNIFPEVDLSKYDPQTKISRRHARIWREGSEFLVEDLGSSNGTLLLSRVSDTLRLSPHQPHPITSGDRLRIGDTTLQFIVG